MDKFLLTRNKQSGESSGGGGSGRKDNNSSPEVEVVSEDKNSNSRAGHSESESETSVAAVSNKRRKISWVWNYFKRSSDRKLAKCVTCGKEYKTSGNTSNLSDHLKRFHPINKNKHDTDNDELFASTSSSSSALTSARSSNRSISPFFKRSIEYESTSKRKKDLDRALTLMIVRDFQPFNIVNDSGFRKFVCLLDPRYVIPSKFTIRETVMKNLYTECSNKLKKMLTGIKYVSITCDTWTSVSTESYLSATCHFILDSSLKSVVLTAKHLTNNHTSQHLADALQEIFDEWDISNKITCIVTDNAANMIKTCEILKKRHLPCFAHTLNLVVQDNLSGDGVQNVLTKCKEIVRFFKSSTSATDTFKEEQLNIEGSKIEPLKLIQEVSTRWNSSLYMIQRILRTSDAINRTLLKMRRAPSPLTVDEIAILRDFEASLSSFDEATKKVSGSAYVTVSLIIPLTFGIFTSLNDAVKTMTTAEGRNFCDGLIESTRKRLFLYESRSVTRISTLLDPRFKKEGFRNKENANQAANLLEQEMVQNSHIMGSTAENSDNTNNGDEARSSQKKSLFAFVTQRVEEKTKSTTADMIIRKRQYLERNNAAEETDPLLFWKVNGKELQPIPELSLKYLCIPASSTESEREFSATGLIINDRRSRLKPKNVNKIIFLNKNHWLLEFKQ